MTASVGNFDRTKLGAIVTINDITHARSKCLIGKINQQVQSCLDQLVAADAFNSVRYKLPLRFVIAHYLNRLLSSIWVTE